MNRRVFVMPVIAPDQMPQNAGSDQGLHCLTLVQQFLDTSAGSKTDLFKFKDEYGNVNPCHAKYIKMPRPLLIFSQSDYLIRIVAINSHT